MIASPRGGFTLLEVMIALAIMAGIVLTLLSSVNYHLGVLSRERDQTALTLLARAKLVELEQGGGVPARSEGTLAPQHPEVKWQAELVGTQLPGLQKLVLKLQRVTDRREVALVRYVIR